ncbi:MAG TPA: M20/M25/M40 family metallo-hydrolase [Longimicrobiales bacterium]
MRISFAIVASCALLACSTPPAQPGGPAALPDAAGTITAEDMRARIGFLASDALRGRDTPSPGLDSAAAWIAREFERLRLEPGGENGTYHQRYPFTIRTVNAEQSSWGQLRYGQDFFVWPGSPLNIEGEVVFIGGRLNAAPASAIRDKVPMIYVGGELNRDWRTAVNSARNAAQFAGARGLIVVLDSAVTEADVQQRAQAFRRTTTASPVNSIAFVRYERARALLRAGNHDLGALRAGTSVTPVLSQTAIIIGAEVNEQRPPNVAGILRGSDPTLRDTYVVISAHMDHVGVGTPDATGDSIYNGADDDASGTSAVLEVAEALASMPQRPARSVMFLLVSGEEKGLLGSRYFSEHPTVPLQNVVANVNIDMIGRNSRDTVVAIGQEYSSLGPLVQEVVRAHPELGLTAARDLWPQERFFFRSDHFNFARKEIPAIFFFTGVHDDYHRPSDEVEKIDADKAARVARLAYYLTREIATRRQAPEWSEEGLREVRALTR